jgi:hypothetical protein
MIIAGRRGVSAPVLRSEVDRLRSLGWRLEQPITIVANDDHTSTVGLGHHGAVAILDGPYDIYVAFEYLDGVRDLDQAVALNRGRSVAPLRREIRNGTPMLSATLGHQHG